MTPRPQIFAVQQSITLETFLEKLKEQNYSRVPVYEGTLDSITGIAFAHDLLQISDEEARSRTVSSIQQPAVFVPETKRGYELLREMQREKQHMRVVIDEYGGVAGLVTIEDLIEEIVGDIRDEHEEEGHVGDPLELNEDYEATTVGGLVSEVEGRIPLPGEVVLLVHSGLRIQVVASTDRRVDRLRIYPPA